MEFCELLLKRRSIRSYKDEPVLEKDVNEIVKAALYAPSWRNCESGRYYVALSDEAINTVYESLPDFNKASTKNSAYIIATYKLNESGTVGTGEYTDDLKDRWGAYDLGLQNAYLMLEASELGYDTLVMGLRDVDKIREYFAIPDDEVIMPVIAIGKRAVEPNLNKRKEVEEVLKIK